MTLYILPTANPTRRHVNINGRFHLRVSLASVARIARYALNLGLTAYTNSDGTVYR